MLDNQYQVNPLTWLDEIVSLHEQIQKLKLEARDCTSTERRRENSRKPNIKPFGNGTGRIGVQVLDKLDESYDKFSLLLEKICKVSNLDCPSRQALVNGKLPYYTFIDACMFLRSYLEVCFDQFRSLRKNTELSSLLSPLKTMSQWPVHLFPKYCKYVTAYPHAYLCRDTDPSNMPPLPEGFNPGIRAALLFKGCALSFFLNRMKGRISRKTYNFTWAIVAGVKRGTATVSPFFVLDTMVKHKQALSKIPIYDEDDLNEFDDHLERMTQRRVTDSAFLREVSTSASYETKRSTGGAREYIREMFKDSSELIRMSYDPHNGVQEFRSSYPLRSLNDILSEKFTGTGFRTEFLPRAMVAPVLEPLKCRLITKGNSLEYWLSRGFQQDMWKFLGNFEQFSPTRRPLDLSDFYAILQKEKALNTQFSYWVSGDYSAATDGLNMHYSKETLEFLIRRSDFKNLGTLQQVKYRDLLRSVLGEHEVEYPINESLKNKLADILLSYLSEPALRRLKDVFKTQCNLSPDKFDSECQKITDNPDNWIYPPTLMRGFRDIWDKADTMHLEEPFHQNNGQLMGSTLSFPVLCLVNAVQYWRSIEEYLGHEVEFKNLPVLINGDDILFRSNPEHYAIWKKYIGRCGFELSQGKNYLSRNFFCINTRGYFYSEKDTKITPLPALNVGLLMGKSKGSSNGEFGDKLMYAGIDEIYKGMLESATDKKRATKRFLHYNKENVAKITQNGLYNLGIPRALGGVGLVLPEGISQYRTLFQKCLVRKLYRQLKRGFRSTCPQSEQPVKVVPRFESRNLPKKLNLEHTWLLQPFGPLRKEDHLPTLESHPLDETFSVHAPELEQDRQGMSIMKLKTNFYSRQQIEAILKDTSLRSGGLKKPIEIISSQRLVYRDHLDDML